MPAYQGLRVFVSSPGDVSDEREIVSQVLHEVNRVCRERLGVVLEDISWNGSRRWRPR